MNTKGYETIKVWKTTLRNLRFLHALLGDSIVAILDRLVAQELERAQRAPESEQNNANSESL